VIERVSPAPAHNVTESYGAFSALRWSWPSKVRRAVTPRLDSETMAELQAKQPPADRCQGARRARPIHTDRCDESVSDAFVFVDRHERIVLFNSGFCRLLERYAGGRQSGLPHWPKDQAFSSQQRGTVIRSRTRQLTAHVFIPSLRGSAG